MKYSGLEKILAERGINKSDLTKELGISSRTIAKISKEEKLSNIVLTKIADYLECSVEDLTRDSSDERDQVSMGRSLVTGHESTMKKIVIFGGGTGISSILSGLKLFPLDVTAVIAVTV